MEAEKIGKIFPPAPPHFEAERAPEDTRYVWEILVPRLVHDPLIAIVEAFLAAGRALTPNELSEIVGESPRRMRDLCRWMKKYGVLELVPQEAPGERPSLDEAFFLRKPPNAKSGSELDPEASP